MHGSVVPGRGNSVRRCRVRLEGRHGGAWGVREERWARARLAES